MRVINDSNRKRTRGLRELFRILPKEMKACQDVRQFIGRTGVRTPVRLS